MPHKVAHDRQYVQRDTQVIQQDTLVTGMRMKSCPLCGLRAPLRLRFPTFVLLEEISKPLLSKAKKGLAPFFQNTETGMMMLFRKVEVNQNCIPHQKKNPSQYDSIHLRGQSSKA